MKWYIIRHADKEEGDFYNPVLGRQDQPISAKGWADARRLDAYFSGKSIARIYRSEFIRTEQTIAYVAQKMALSPIVDGRLNEINNGVVEWMPDQEIRQKYPDVWNAFRERDHDFQFPEGESGADVQRRIKSFMAERQAYEEDIILVTHDGWIRLFMCHILGLPVYRRWDFHVDTCGITEIEYQPEFESWKLRRFNHIIAL